MESQERYGWGASEGDDNRPDEFSRNDRRPSESEPGNGKRAGKSTGKVNCPDCGKEVKNLGAHQRWCKQRQKQQIIVDEYMGQSLSFTIESIRQVLKSVSYNMTTKLDDTNGDFTELELTIRIPLKRR